MPSALRSGRAPSRRCPHPRRPRSLRPRSSSERALPADRVDLVRVDELQDVDGPHVRQATVDVLIGEDHVVVLLVLVAFYDLVEGNLFPVDRASALVLDAPLVLRMELVELEAFL